MRRLMLAWAALLIGGCAALKDYESVQSGPRAEITLSRVNKTVSVDNPELFVGVWVPDAGCNFQPRGSITVKRKEQEAKFAVPPGRVYVGTSANLLHGPIVRQQASFLVEDGQAYSIEFEQLRREDPKVGYAFHYTGIDPVTRKAVRVDEDYWSICEREKLARNGSVVTEYGCVGSRCVDAVMTGPKAGVVFLSPALEDTPLARDKLRLSLLEPDARCGFVVSGRFPLSSDSTKRVTHIPANDRAYFRIERGSHGYFGDSSDIRLEFSLAVEDGMTYTIEHIDTPTGLRMKYFKHTSAGERMPIEVQGLEACEVR